MACHSYAWGHPQGGQPVQVTSIPPVEERDPVEFWEEILAGTPPARGRFPHPGSI